MLKIIVLNDLVHIGVLDYLRIFKYYFNYNPHVKITWPAECYSVILKSLYYYHKLNVMYESWVKNRQSDGNHKLLLLLDAAFTPKCAHQQKAPGVEWSESFNETVTQWQHHLLRLITQRPLSTSLHPTATLRSNGWGLWVCPQLMQTSVVIAVGSPSHVPLLCLSPVLLLLLLLLLWRPLSGSGMKPPLRFLSRAKKIRLFHQPEKEMEILPRIWCLGHGIELHEYETVSRMLCVENETRKSTTIMRCNLRGLHINNIKRNIKSHFLCFWRSVICTCWFIKYFSWYNGRILNPTADFSSKSE